MCHLATDASTVSRTHSITVVTTKQLHYGIWELAKDWSFAAPPLLFNRSRCDGSCLCPSVPSRCSQHRVASGRSVCIGSSGEVWQVPRLPASPPGRIVTFLQTLGGHSLRSVSFHRSVINVHISNRKANPRPHPSQRTNTTGGRELSFRADMRKAVSVLRGMAVRKGDRGFGNVPLRPRDRESNVLSQRKKRQEAWSICNERHVYKWRQPDSGFPTF